MNLRSVLSNPFALWFLAGCFLTSLGSTTYLICLLALASRMGIPTWYLGFLVGAQRLTVFVINMVWGHASDQIRPRTILLITEFGGVLGSLGLALALGQLQEGTYWM